MGKPLRAEAAAPPLTYVVNLLSGPWTGEAWSQHTVDVIILAGVLVAGVLITVKFFRWE